MLKGAEVIFGERYGLVIHCLHCSSILYISDVWLVYIVRVWLVYNLFGGIFWYNFFMVSIT